MPKSRYRYWCTRSSQRCRDASPPCTFHAEAAFRRSSFYTVMCIESKAQIGRNDIESEREAVFGNGGRGREDDDSGVEVCHEESHGLERILQFLRYLHIT